MIHHPINHHSSNCLAKWIGFFVSNKKMIPASTSLVPHRPLGYHWSCESKELELESTRFSELDTQREQLEALIQGKNW